MCAFGSSNEMNIINNYLCFVQELSLLVEEQERDGEGAAAMRPRPGMRVGASASAGSGFRRGASFCGMRRQPQLWG